MKHALKPPVASSEQGRRRCDVTGTASTNYHAQDKPEHDHREKHRTALDGQRSVPSLGNYRRSIVIAKLRCRLAKCEIVAESKTVHLQVAMIATARANALQPNRNANFPIVNCICTAKGSVFMLLEIPSKCVSPSSVLQNSAPVVGFHSPIQNVLVIIYRPEVRCELLRFVAVQAATLVSLPRTWSETIMDRVLEAIMVRSGVREENPKRRHDNTKCSRHCERRPDKMLLVGDTVLELCGLIQIGYIEDI